MLNDVVPLVRHLTWRDTLGVTGCSFGAYHAMAFALRYPYTFTSCITMGGAFDISRFLDGYFDEDCYFLDPSSFLPGLSDCVLPRSVPPQQVGAGDGRHDICRGDNEQFSGLLDAKGIPHACTCGTTRSTTGRTGGRWRRRIFRRGSRL